MYVLNVLNMDCPISLLIKSRPVTRRNALCVSDHTKHNSSKRVNSCPLTKFDGGLLRLHEADEAAIDWLTAYGS